jgi:prephenate dehydrogenase
MHWRKATLVGVGLLGGSLGMALRRLGIVQEVHGYVRRPASVPECIRLGAVDRATIDLAAAARDADLIVLCTPLGQMRELVERMRPHLKAGALMTDVGSVKGPVVHDLEPLLFKHGARFVGSHPMAGGEKTGVEAARSDLFNGAVCVVTPTARTDPDALQQIEQLWKQLGSRLLRLTPELHDEFVSRSSHLPHIVAAELSNYVLSPAYPREQGRLCANGFRDTTRIASGSPEMWRDIVLSNRKHLARALGVFIEDLREFQLAVENGDEKVIHEFFETAKQRRDQWRADGARS